MTDNAVRALLAGQGIDDAPASTEPLGVGIVGLSGPQTWAAQAHRRAILATPGLQLRGLATRSTATAKKAAAEYDLGLAFDDVAALASHADIDVVVICVRVPAHREAVLAAAPSGKVLVCEWPLARSAGEARELVHTTSSSPAFVSLQGRAAPFLTFLRELVADGYLGRVLTTSMVGSSPRWGATIDPGLEWILDRDQGATMLTIPVGHALDMMRTVLGDPVDLVATTGVLRPTVVLTGSDTALSKTGEDQVAVSGTLGDGAVFSIHYRGGPTGGTQFLWEILGAEGELAITSGSGHIQRGSDVQIHGARAGRPWTRLQIPERYDLFPDLLGTAAHTVAHSYARIVGALRGAGGTRPPGFDDALTLHHILEAVRTSAATGARASAPWQPG